VQTWILSENMTDERQNRQIDNDAFWAPFISADYLKRYNSIVMQDLLQKLASKELLGRPLSYRPAEGVSNDQLVLNHLASSYAVQGLHRRRHFGIRTEHNLAALFYLLVLVLSPGSELTEINALQTPVE
jgi:hypothetical protein